MRVNFLSAGLLVFCLTSICPSLFSQSYTPKYVVGPGEYNCFILNSSTHQLYEAAGGNAPHLVTGAPANVAYAAASLHHFGLIDNAGNCYVWGDNQYGEIGNGVTGATLSTPQLISKDINGNAFNNVVQIVPGASTYGYNTAALKGDGTVWVWGNTNGGLIGNGTTGGNTTRPSQVIFPAGTVIKKIMFDVIGIALDASGNVWTWGGNMGYQSYILGQGTTAPSTNKPAKIPLPSPAKEISGGGLWSYALLSNGQLYGWSIYPSYLGIGTSGFLAEIAPSTKPILLDADLAFPAPVAHIYTNPVCSYALLTDSTIWAWGDNAMGNIGNGVELNYAKYATNPAPYGASAAPYAWDWGYGELLQQKPVHIANGLHSFTNIFSDRGDAFYAYAEDVHGNLYSWGRNKVGVLGNGIYEADYTNGNIASQYPNSWDVAGVTAIDPFAITKMHLTSSPYCVTNPKAYPCNVYTIPSTPAPTVSAGANQNITTAATTVTGVATGNGGAVINYYAWTQVSGPTTSLITLPTGAVATVSNLANGTYVLQLKVTDNNWRTSTSNVTIVVNTNGAKPPVANAGTNVSIQLPLVSVTTLNGSASTDPNTGGGITAYQWSLVSGPSTYLLTGATTATPLFTGLGAGVYVLQLKVTNKAGLTATSTVTVTVTALLAKAPSASAGSDVSIQLPTSSASLSAAGSTDPNTGGKISTYLWTIAGGPAGGTLINATSATPTFTSTVAGVYTLKVTVTDNLGMSSSSTVTVTVVAAVVSKPPVANPGTDPTLQLPAQNSIKLNGSASSDPNSGGSITAYQWTVASGPSTYTWTSATTATPTLSGLVAGTYVIQLKVTDKAGLSSTATVDVIVLPAPVYKAPIANAGSDQILQLPGASSTILSALGSSDPNAGGSITAYQWTVISAPSGYVLSGSTKSEASIYDMPAGVYQIKLTVTDNYGKTASDTTKITVEAAPAPNYKVPAAKAGASETLQLPAASSLVLNGSASTDPNTGGKIVGYLWSVVSGPSTYTLSSATSAEASLYNLGAGKYIVQLTVLDNYGLAASDTLTVTVLASSAKLPVAVAGANQTLQLPGTSSTILSGSKSSDPNTGGKIVHYLWSVVSGPSTYRLSGDTSVNASFYDLVAGQYTVKLQVTDNLGLSASSTMTVTVLAATSNQPPVAKAGSDVMLQLPTTTSTVLNGSQSYDLNKGGSIAAYKWSVISGPSTYTFSNAGVVSPAFYNLVAGVYKVKLTVTDNLNLSASDTVVITVNAITPLLANAGKNILLQLPQNSTVLNGTASQGAITSFNWSLVSGPAQYTLNGSTDSLVTLSNLEVGTYKVALTVKDSLGNSASDTVAVAVIVDIASPTAIISNTDTTLTLSDTLFVLDGSQSTAPTGGQITSYSWKEVGGPSTVQFVNPTGSTTGVNDLQAGAYMFQLTVTGNNGAQSTATITITVGTLSATSVKIYPNPVANDLNVSLSSAISGKVTMDIFDELGHHVLTNTVEKAGQAPATEHMDVSSLARGAYFLRVSTQGERVTVKMIKVQ